MGPTGLLGQLALAAGALGLAAWLVRLLRREGRGERAALLVLALAGLLALLARDDLRLYSFHGLLHASIVYRILGAGLPPDDPLFAGELLRYPWGLHVLVAGAVRGLGVTPPTGFALVNPIGLGLVALAVDRAAAELGARRGERAVAVVLALGGGTALAAGPGATLLRAASGIGPDGRLLAFQKFLNANANQVGILLFATGLASLLRRARHPDRRAPLLGLGASVLGAALLYPLAWLGLAAGALASAAALLLLEGRERLGPRALDAGVVLGASLLALPFLLLIGTGKAPADTRMLLPSLAHLARSGVQLVAIGAAPALLLVLERRALVAQLRARPGPALVLACMAGANALLLGVLHLPLHSEYKFGALAVVALAPPTAVALGALARRRAAAALVVLALLLLPAATRLAHRAASPSAPVPALRERGGSLVPHDPEEAALYRFVRERTPEDAVFVDRRLDVAALGRRRLFVAPDASPRAAEARPIERGWSMDPSIWLARVVGHPEAEIARRRRATRALLEPGPARETERALALLRERLPDAPVYLLARSPRNARKLSGSPLFRRVYAGRSTEVFALAAAPRGAEDETLGSAAPEAPARAGP